MHYLFNMMVLISLVICFSTALDIIIFIILKHIVKLKNINQF